MPINPQIMRICKQNKTTMLKGKFALRFVPFYFHFFYIFLVHDFFHPLPPFPFPIQFNSFIVSLFFPFLCFFLSLCLLVIATLVSHVTHFQKLWTVSFCHEYYSTLITIRVTAKKKNKWREENWNRLLPYCFQLQKFNFWNWNGNFCLLLRILLLPLWLLFLNGRIYVSCILLNVRLTVANQKWLPCNQFFYKYLIIIILMTVNSICWIQLIFRKNTGQ